MPVTVPGYLLLALFDLSPDLALHHFFFTSPPPPQKKRGNWGLWESETCFPHFPTKKREEDWGCAKLAEEKKLATVTGPRKK